MAKSKSYMASYRARQRTTATSPMSAGNFQQLADYMMSAHGITLDPSVQQLDFEAVKAGLDGVATVLSEFPQMAGTIDRITYDPSTSAYAYARYEYTAQGVRTSVIAMSDMFRDSSSLEASLTRDGSFHPPNTNARAVLAHETGHALETAIARSRHSDAWDSFTARKKRTEATRIVGAAAREVKRTPDGRRPDGKSKSVVDIIGEVSGYASTNRSEAFAECIGDYVANGSRAHPLSQAVWRLAKAEMG